MIDAAIRLKLSHVGTHTAVANQYVTISFGAFHESNYDFKSPGTLSQNPQNQEALDEFFENPYIKRVMGFANSEFDVDLPLTYADQLQALLHITSLSFTSSMWRI